jgi:calcineurin-like phosphoesterase family protein
MRWFTSDLHLGHKNIVDFCDRPFVRDDGQPDVDKMFDTLLINFQRCVKPGDELFILGDLAFDVNLAIRFLDALPCQKFMIWGNHDPKKGKERQRLLEHVVTAKDIMETIVGDTKAVMCHYPMLRWNKAHFGSYMLHGHTHSELKYPYEMRILDVGVDNAWTNEGGGFHQAYLPVSETEVTKYMAGILPIKHHYFKGEGM